MKFNRQLDIKENLISVIIPVYNSELYIKETLESIINQTYQNIEVIIIDDCSSDNSAKIVREYSKNDSRIKYYINEINKGVSFSRNRGVNLALGEWIAFIDSDDRWVETKLEEQIKVANEMNGEFIFTGSSFIDENGEKYPGIYNVPKYVNYKELLKSNYLSCSSVLIKRKYLIKYPFGRDDIHEDYTCWLKILRNEYITAFGVSKPLLIYRISKKSKSGNKIKSAKMVYGSYRDIGLTSIQAMYYWCYFFVNRNKKYKKIKRA